MEKMQEKKQWHLIRNDNGEWISDEYVVYISKLEAGILKVYAAKQGKPLTIQNGSEGGLWCYKHELEAIELKSQKECHKTLKIKKVYKR